MGELTIKVKYSREITDPGTPAIEENFKTGQLQWSIPVSDAALLLVDCWGNYPLKSFSERASEICKNTIRTTMWIRGISIKMRKCRKAVTGLPAIFAVWF